MSQNEREALEARILELKLLAPRVDLAGLLALIVNESFTMLPSGKTYICELTLRNGFTVIGKSAVVSRENFNEEIGQRVARDNAIREIWPLEGYLLQQSLYERANQDMVADLPPPPAPAADEPGAPSTTPA